MSVDLQNRSHEVCNENNDVVLAALEIIIDGVASSDVSKETKCAANYIAGLIIADSKGRLDIKKQKAILSILEMAFEVDSPVFLPG